MTRGRGGGEGGYRRILLQSFENPTFIGPSHLSQGWRGPTNLLMDCPLFYNFFSLFFLRGNGRVLSGEEKGAIIS